MCRGETLRKASTIVIFSYGGNGYQLYWDVYYTNDTCPINNSSADTDPYILTCQCAAAYTYTNTTSNTHTHAHANTHADANTYANTYAYYGSCLADSAPQWQSWRYLLRYPEYLRRHSSLRLVNISWGSSRRTVAWFINLKNKYHRWDTNQSWPIQL
jgi:hypothetical protein